MDELNLEINKRNNDELKDLNTNVTMLLKTMVDSKESLFKEVYAPPKDEMIKIIKPLIPKPIKGEKGDKGDAGKNGLQGLTGKQGPVGKQGPAGKDGKNGKDGLDGEDGKDGKDGKNGKDGKDAPVIDINKAIKKAKISYSDLSDVPPIEEWIAKTRKASKTVSLKELDDVDLSNATISNGKYVIGGGTGGAVDSVNGETGVVVLDADDISDTTTTHKFVTAAEKTKLGFITVTQTVDLDDMEADINALEQAVVLKGTWDASAGTFPGAGSAQAGWSYIVSVGGTVDTVVFVANDRIVAITDNASTGTYSANWHKLDYTDAVLSVAGRTGAVTLTADDVTETATKKWLTDTEETKLGHITVSQAVDLDTMESNIALNNAKPTISSGAGAPGSTPTKVGDIYIDTTGDDAYIAVGTASAADWEKTNDGAGGGLSDGDKGDVTVSSSGSIWTIDADAVSYSKIQNVSATDRILGRSGIGAGDIEEITCTSFARSILDDADEATFKATVNLEIGVDVQAYSSILANTTASYTTADETKVDYLTVTQAVNLDQMEIDIAALANGMVYKGDWDASAGTFPGAGAAQAGWFYYVSIAGTVDGVAFSVGDNIVATVDNASAATYAANWSKHDQTDAVQTVAGRTGAVTLTLADITDVTATITELNYIDGVTSAIQTQLNAKQSTITFGTGVQTALGVNIGSAGAPVLFNGALGTPSSGTLTNATGLPATSIVAGTLGTGAYTMDTSLSVPQMYNADRAIAASGNAATVTRTYRNNVVTNNSAATLTITMSTTSATAGDMLLVQVLDFSGVAQTITWVNTENSTVAVPTTSNGSTTLPVTVGFKWNALTSKWRCIASA